MDTTSVTPDQSGNTRSPIVEPDNGRKEVVFIDTSVADYRDIAAGVNAGATVVEFDGSQDGLAQIAQWAEHNSGYDAIHIISHGGEGRLTLGTHILDHADLVKSTTQATLAEIGHALKADGDILLYGCNVAAGSVGQQFIADFAAATGADVAASTNVTGNAALGGDWVLESATGKITTTSLKVVNYQRLLANITFNAETAGNTAVSGNALTDTESGVTLKIEGTNKPVVYGDGINVGHWLNGTGSYLFGDTSDTETSVTFSLTGGQTFDLVSFAAIGATVTKTVTIATNKGGSTDFTLPYSVDNPINQVTQTFATAAYQGITSFTITSAILFTGWIDDIVLQNIVSGPTTTISTSAFSADTGSSSTDFITKTASQTVSGTLSANVATGETVNVSLDNGSTWTAATTTVGQNTWSLASQTLTTSSTLKVKVSNASGDGTVYSQAYTLDATAPSAPSTPDMASGSDTGTSSTDDITNDTTPTITGTAEADSTVTLYDTDGTTSLGTATATGGNWSITASTLTTGSHTLTAKATDTAGNTSAASTGLAVTIDTAAPTLSSSTPADNATAVAVGSNIVLTFNENVAVGTGNIVISNGTDTRTIAVGDAQVTISGNTVTINPTADLNTETTYYVQMASGVLTDTAGNAYAGISDTTTLNFSTPDTTAPTIGSVTSTKTNGSYKAGDSIAVTVQFSEVVNVTGTPQLTLETGTTDRTVNYTSGSGTNTLTFNYTVQAGDTSADLDYASTSALALNGGTIKDAAGNAATLTLATPGAANSLGNNKALVIDTTAPSAPSTPDLASGSDSGSSSTDDITSATTPTLTGTAESGSTVTLYDTNGTTSLGTATATGGSWSITSSALSAGNHTLTAKATDAVGNTSTASTGLTVAVDTAAPTGVGVSATTIAVVSATGTATIATLSATDDHAVTYSLVSGNGTNDANNGSFTITGTSLKVGGTALTAGTYNLYVAATDAAGNVANQALTLTVVDAPSVSSIVRANSASATVAGSATLVDYTVTFSESVTGVDTSDFALTTTGTAAGTIASITGSGTTYTVTVNSLSGDGTVRLDLNSSGTSIQNGSSVAIAAGYTSGNTYTLDHTAPAAPSTPDMADVSDSGTSSTDNITSDTAPTLTGTAEAGSTVTLYDTNGTTSLGTATATGGNWSITSSTLTAGSHTLTAKAADAVGNVSSASTGLAVTIDTDAPVIGTAAINGTSLVLTYTDADSGLLNNPPLTTSYLVNAGSSAIGVTNVAIDSTARTVTLTLASAVTSSDVVTVSTSGQIRDLAGNLASGFSNKAVTNNTPAPASSGGGGGGGGSDTGTNTAFITATVDGTTVQTATETTTSGETVTTQTIAPVATTRHEDTSTANSSLADIPLVKDGSGETLLLASLPVGVGLTSQAITGTGTTTLRDLLISASTPKVTDTAEFNKILADGIDAYVPNVQDQSQVAVRTLSLTDTTGKPQSVVVTGSQSATQPLHQEALVIDTRSLPAGSEIKLDNVNFAIVVGDAIVTGGNANNFIIGDNANQTVHTGSGNDVINGGGGTDLLRGGTSSDTATFNGSSDHYKVTYDYGKTIVTSLDNPSDVTTLVNVESLKFANQNVDVTSHTQGLSWIATVYQNALGRQADLGGFQFWSAQTTGNGVSDGAATISLLNTSEIQQKTGVAFNTLDATAQIEFLYSEVLGRASDAAGKTYWMQQYQHGVSIADIATQVVQSAELTGKYLAPTGWDFYV